MTALLCMLLALLLGGCAQEEQGTGSARATVRPRVTVTPEPTLNNEPAQLLTGVSTEKRVVSLVFEGYTDETTMNQVIETVRQRGVRATFFVTGIMASEHSEIVRSIAQAGMQIGNYTISAEKEMEKNTVDVNLHQLTRAQELIVECCGVTPALARLNGTEHTQNVLKAVAAAGLEAAVEPGLYLNHRSFSAQSDAQRYVENLVRGEIISIKLGQELDLGEYGDEGEALDERPAIDPSPNISRDSLKVENSTYQNIPSVVTWLLDALEQGGYTVVTPQELQEYRVDLLGEAQELTQETLDVLDTARYDLPVTDAPIGTTQTRAGTEDDFAGVVFVGDSVMDSIGDYVAYRRVTEPDFMGGTQFLTASNLTVESALQPVSETSVHPLYEGQKRTIESALHAMGAKKVYLMMRFGNTRAYAQEAYIKNLELLIYLIRQENPGIEVVVLSLLPGVAGRSGTPTNMQIFRLNLMICRMCMEHDIPYLDAAYALRDEQGDLPMAYCLDPDLYGIHLNDAGCDVWLDYVLSHIP